MNEIQTIWLQNQSVDLMQNPVFSRQIRNFNSDVVIQQILKYLRPSIFKLNASQVDALAAKVQN